MLRRDVGWTVPTAGRAGSGLVKVDGQGPEHRWRTTCVGHGYDLAPRSACEGR